MEYITHQRSLGFSPLRLEDKAFEVLNGATSIEHGANNSLIFNDVPGGAASPNLVDATIVGWRMRDVFGSALSCSTSEILTSRIVKLLEVVAPALTSDTYVAVGIINNVSIAAADGHFVGIVYTGSDRDLRSGLISLGVTTASDTINLGATFDLAAQDTNHQRAGRTLVASSQAYDSADVTTALGLKTQFVTRFADGDQYIIVGVGRTSAVAGAVSPEFIPRYVPANPIDLRL